MFLLPQFTLGLLGVGESMLASVDSEADELQYTRLKSVAVDSPKALPNPESV